MLGDASQDIGQPGLRIDVIHLGGDDQAVEGGGPLAAAVGTGEQPRFSAQRYTAQGSFRCVVGEADAAVIKEQVKAAQRFRM